MGTSPQDAARADANPAKDAAPRFFQLAEMVADLRAVWAMDGSQYLDTLAIVCRYAPAMMGAEAAYAMLQAEGQLRVVASHVDGSTGGLALDLSDADHPAVLALRTGQAQVATGPAAQAFHGDSVLFEPIAGKEASLGVFVFPRRGAQTFQDVDRATANVLSRQASFGAAMHRQARELKLIYGVTRTITSSLQLDEVLECIYQGFAQILPADNFYIALWDGGDEIRFEIEIEERQRKPKRKRKWLSGLTEYVLTSRKPLLIPKELTKERERLGIALSGRNAKCWIGAPMVYRDKAVGVIALQSYEREYVYDNAHLSVLENLAGQAAVAIENARLYQETRASLEQLQTTQLLLLQSEKLAAVGQLISGIAHELNNPLTGVVGWTQYLLAQPLSKEVARHLTTINEQALRASKIVQNLLTFSRQHKPEQRIVNLNEILDSTLALRAYELRVNNVVVERQFAQDLPRVAADPHQIQQVVLNLIINAEQAMLAHKGSGKLTVETARRNDRVLITIADDGPGIPQNLLAKIFDPFFTTKPIGVGTGLGLSISFGIIQEHLGRIWAESDPATGAKFFIELPMSEIEVASQPSAAPAAKPPANNQPNLLIVDDEESVRDLLHIVLQEMSMNVDMATNGEEALAMSTRHTYDLIISDLKMPGLSGAEFYEKLHATRGPATPRFMFVTGDVLSSETREFLESTNSLCVLKPFDLADVRKTVAEALQRRVRAAGAAD